MYSLAAAPLATAAPQTLREPLKQGVDYQSADVSRIIYLDRCVGGCIIDPGPDDARTNTSSILNAIGSPTAAISGGRASGGQGAGALALVLLGLIIVARRRR